MKKVRLNENDIENLVKRIIKEDTDGVPGYIDKAAKDILGPNGNTNHYYTVDDFVSDIVSTIKSWKFDSPWGGLQPGDREYIEKMFWDRNTSEGDDYY